MKHVRTIAIAAAIVLSAALALVAVQRHRSPGLGSYAALTLAPAAKDSPVRVRFAGVSTLMFDDGETAFLTDGFFSRPSFSSILLTRIETDQSAVDAGLVKLGQPKLAAVVVLHGHYDHAMDAPLVALKTGATLVGDKSIMNVGRGAGLPVDRMRPVSSGETLELGAWRLTFISARHAPTPFSDGKTGGRIDAPLTQPARASSWHEGEVWSLLVEHRSGPSYLVQGSAGYIEGALRGRKADVVFLGVGAAGKQSDGYRERLWAEIPKAVGARVVVPIHWDDFWLRLDEPLRAMPFLVDDFGATMESLQRLSAVDGVQLRMPPVFTPFAP